VDFDEQGGGLDKRLIEQQASGTMREQAGRYVLTARGKAICAVSDLMCQAFACQRKRPHGHGQIANFPVNQGIAN
jgi:hypothetical protein